MLHMTETEQIFSSDLHPANGAWSELRKYRKDLTVAGNALLWFGVWSVIKTYLTVMLNEDLAKLITEQLNPAQLNEAYAMLQAMTILTGVVFLVHFLIYRGSQKEGHGQKTGPFYLVLAFVFFAACLISIILTLFHVTGIQENPVVSILLDVTTAGISADILFNGIHCRRLAQKLKTEESI